MTNELMKKLDEAIKANLTKSETLEFLRTQGPELIADMNGAEEFLQKDYSGDVKLKQIKIAYRVKEELLRTRPHDGSEPKEPYAVYKGLYPNGGMKSAQFNEVFYLVDRIKLEHEKNYSKFANNMINEWRKLGKSDDSLVDILKVYSADRNMANALRQYAGIDNQDVLAREVFSKVLRNLIKEKRVPADAYCQLTEEKKTSNDTALENCVIYYLFFTMLRQNESILVVEPSPAFIKKLMEEHSYPRGLKATFAISDTNAIPIYSYGYGDRGKFIPLTDIEKNLCAEGTPAHTLVFGTRYDKTAELLESLKKYENGRHTVSIFDTDFGFFEEGLHRQLCDAEMANRRVWLFPSDINYCTYPQRKALFSATFGSKTNADNLDKIRIDYYQLLKNSKKTDVAQYLRKKLLQVEMPLEGYVAKGSFRSAYERQEALTLLATARMRKVPVEMELTPEIMQYYTISVSGGRFAVEAYVRSPKTTQEQKWGEVAQLTKKRTRHQTEQMSDEQILSFAWWWSKRVYPYEKVIQKNKKVRYIQEEIAKVYRSALKWQGITLKTMVYIYYPEIEKALPKIDMKRLNILVNSELGEVLLNNLSYEYVSSVVEKLYSDGQDFEAYRAMLALSKVINIAKKYGHADCNELEKLLEEDRAEKKNIRDIRNNLTKSNLTEAEMRRLYKKVINRIVRGESEYLGLLIRLLTGLESNIVCALCWKDVMKLPGFTFRGSAVYQLCVRRQARNDGREICRFETVQSYRYVPCPQILADFLLQEMGRQVEALSLPQNALMDMPVVRRDDKMVSAGTMEVFPPRKLSELGKKCIKALGIPDQVIRIPDSNNGTIESNLSEYQSDLLHSNYGHWARHLGKLDEGEISYLMGRKAEITFSVNYCDYENVISQFQLFLKQNRIASVVLQPVSVEDRQKFAFSGKGVPVKKHVSLAMDRTKRTHTNLEVSVPKGTGKINALIVNECGFDVLSVSQIEGD